MLLSVKMLSTLSLHRALMLCTLMVSSVKEAMYIADGHHQGEIMYECLISDRVLGIQLSALLCVLVCSVGL